MQQKGKGWDALMACKCFKEWSWSKKKSSSQSGRRSCKLCTFSHLWYLSRLWSTLTFHITFILIYTFTLLHLKSMQLHQISSFLFHIPLPCLNLLPRLPTMQLHCRLFGWRCWCVTLLVACCLELLASIRDEEQDTEVWWSRFFLTSHHQILNSNPTYWSDITKGNLSVNAAFLESQRSHIHSSTPQS